MNHSKIITVTLNPSLDETVTINYLNLGYHNLATDTIRLDASGRGVNVSRALNELEAHTHALVLLGNDAMGHAYKGLLVEQAFASTIIRHSGHTRSDTILYDSGDDKETHIIDEGRGTSDESINKVINQLRILVKPDDRVVLAGKLPHDIGKDTYARIAAVMNELGAKVILMAGHEPLDALAKVDIDLVAMSRLETESYFNYPVRTFADMVTGAEKLLTQGVRQVIITNDTFDGAVLVTENEKLLVDMETDNSGTDSGVTDAMVSGYLVGLSQGKSIADAFKYGAAAMLYASRQLGNQFGTQEDLEPLLAAINLQEFDPALKL